MTPDQFRTKLTDRRAEILDKVNERNVIINNLAAENRVDMARADEIIYALEAADLAPSPAPIPETKPVPEKAPRDKCAAAILEDYAGNDLPSGIDDLPEMYQKAYGVRTLRAALNIAHQRRPNQSRAAATEQSDSHTERSAREASPNSAPEGSGGAVTSDGGELQDFPKFLDQRKTKEAVE
jgi:hypothetical protein